METKQNSEMFETLSEAFRPDNQVKNELAIKRLTDSEENTLFLTEIESIKKYGVHINKLDSKLFNRYEEALTNFNSFIKIDINKFINI